MMRTYFETQLGRMVLGDCLDVLADMKPDSVDLIMTSPPYGLLHKKPYGGVAAEEYLDWFRPFARLFHRVLAEHGSLVIDIGGSWNQGVPTRSLYHFKLLIMMCEEFGFHLAQEFYWWNPGRIPGSMWVTVRRVRVKDAIETIWWLSKTPWPKASNRHVLVPYNPFMFRSSKDKDYVSPSGHQHSTKMRTIDNGGSIPPNLIAIANADRSSFYFRYCRENKLPIHPARYPAMLPEYFIRMLTDPGDLVVDPFAGSCVTGEVAERLGRRWVCVELIEDYLKGGLGRFAGTNSSVDESRRAPQLIDEYLGLGLGRRVTVRGKGKKPVNIDDERNYYRVPRPDLLWDKHHGESLPADEPVARMMTTERGKS